MYSIHLNARFKHEKVLFIVGIQEKRQPLVTDELVEFEKQPVQVEDYKENYRSV